MFALLRRLACANNNNALPLRCYASFTFRDVVHETSDESGSLLARFAKHIAVERYKCSEHVLPATKIRYVDYYPITDDRQFQRSVDRTEASQLPALIVHSSSYRPNAPPPTFAMVLNTLDSHALAQLPKMDTTTVLETLYAFLFLMPNWLTRTDFYHAALRRLTSEDLQDATLSSNSKERFVQLCFYLGLQKKRFGGTKASVALQDLLATQLPQYLSALSLLDLALISNAAYKTATLISPEVRSQYESALIDAVLNLPALPGNDALLICYIKALRLQRVRDERVSQHLTNMCLDPKQMALLQPRGLAHIFAYFAEQQWDHPDCLAAIVERLMTLLKPGELRSKDLATFLWGCAQLDCKFSALQFKQLEVSALRKLDNGEYNKFPDNLVDSCLSLVTLGHYSKQLIDAAEELKASQANQPRHRAQQQQPKVDSRLILLRTAVAIEQPSWTDLKPAAVFKELTQAPAYLLKGRNDLTNYAKKLELAAEVEAVQLVCPIEGINLPSLRVRTAGEQERVYFVDLLTPQQSLKFSQKPSSLVRLKRRLLEALGQQVVLLQSEEMANNTMALQQLLKRTQEKEHIEAEVEAASTKEVKAAQGLNN